MDKSPTELSIELLAYAALYEQASVALNEILEKKPGVWLALRGDVQSDTQAERKWNNTQDGIRETRLRLNMKAYEKMMSAIRTRLRIAELEVKNFI